MDSGVLRTDRYGLTMLQAYFRQRMNGPVVFELFVWKLPPHRNFLLAAGRLLAPHLTVGGGRHRCVHRDAGGTLTPVNAADPDCDYRVSS